MLFKNKYKTIISVWQQISLLLLFVMPFDNQQMNIFILYKIIMIENLQIVKIFILM